MRSEAHSAPQTVELIGQGTYGRVYKVRRRSDGRLLVLKSIPFDGLSVEEQQETLVEVEKERARARVHKAQLAALAAGRRA